MPRLRVAIIADYPEEGWPSLDLMAEMVPQYLARGHGDRVQAQELELKIHDLLFADKVEGEEVGTHG